MKIETVGVGVALYVELFVIGQTVEIHTKEHLKLLWLVGLCGGDLRLLELVWVREESYLLLRGLGGFVWNDICVRGLEGLYRVIFVCVGWWVHMEGYLCAWAGEVREE